MKKILAVMFLGLLLWGGVAHADTIRLKDGAVLVGEIVKEGRYSVSIMINGMRHSYGKEQIDQIIRGEGKGTEAQAKPRRVLAEIPKEKVELILRLLQVNGVRDSLRLTFQRIIAEAPPEAQSQLTQLLKANQLMDLVVPIYDSYFSKDEIKELVRFYSSQTGAKNISLTPLIVQETMVEAANYFKQQVPGAQDQPK